jgi:hypothetical protein
MHLAYLLCKFYLGEAPRRSVLCYCATLHCNAVAWHYACYLTILPYNIVAWHYTRYCTALHYNIAAWRCCIILHYSTTVLGVSFPRPF